MNKKSVYTCETCSALYVCLKYFQEHRQRHAVQDNRKIYPCTHCQMVYTSENEAHLHNISHKNEPPHSCEVCQEILGRASGISEEEVDGLKGRRSIGTATDFNIYNLQLDNENMGEEEEEVEEEDEDDEDDDDDAEEEDDDEDDEEDEEEEERPAPQESWGANQTTPQEIVTKPSRPSRSTGKGKGNRKARLTKDGNHGPRKFSCCHCGKSFKTKSHLQRHILTHTGEKPYHCNRCDCRFNQSSSLRNHVIAIHTKEYPHFCNNCSKGFLMPAVLQKHLQTTECGKTNQVVEGL